MSMAASRQGGYSLPRLDGTDVEDEAIRQLVAPLDLLGLVIGGGDQVGSGSQTGHHGLATEAFGDARSRELRDGDDGVGAPDRPADEESLAPHPVAREHLGKVEDGEIVDGRDHRHRSSPGDVGVEPMEQLESFDRLKPGQRPARSRRRASRQCGDRAREFVDGIGLNDGGQLSVATTAECSEDLANVGLDPGSSGAEGEGVESERCSIDVSTPNSVQK